MKRIILIIGLAVLVGVSALLAGKPTENAVVGPQASVSFAKAITLVSPLLYPSGLAAGDLNHDGIPDLAVISSENTTPLDYALGKGNGHFRSWRRNAKVAEGPSLVLLADVDGDGNLDAITSEGGLGLAFGDGKGRLYGG
jgi:FG-GAP-like repeat